MNRLHGWYCASALWKNALANSILPWVLDGVELGQNVLEVGPGPGLTTDILRQRFSNVTAIEIDPQLAAALKQRMSGTNVTVVEGDATNMPFEDQNFSGVVSFTMLHHIPSPALQDQLFAQVFRVLKPGGTFAGIDSRSNFLFELIHIGDTNTPVDPITLGRRLEKVGFTNIKVESNTRRFRFRAQRPRLE